MQSIHCIVSIKHERIVLKLISIVQDKKKENKFTEEIKVGATAELNLSTKSKDRMKAMPSE